MIAATLKLEIVALGENRFMCRLGGAQSSTPAHLTTLPFDESGWLEEFLERWKDNATFQQLTDADLQSFGQKLFHALFSAKMQTTLGAATIASPDGVRIAIALEGARLFEIPFELLHDGERFIESGIQLIRIAGSRAAPQAGFRPLNFILIVLAEPDSEDLWNRDEHRDALIELLRANQSLATEVLTPPTPQHLQQRLRELHLQGIVVDALYIVAHGEANAGADGSLVLEGPSNKNRIDGASLAQLLQDHPGCFVYLNSCSSAVPTSANVFSGVAQRLVSDGRAAAVLAMQRPVLAQWAVETAAKFFSEITGGTLAEEAAYVAKRALAGRRDAAVPCFYSTLSGPEEEEAARLASFLNADPDSARLAIVLPHFKMGLLEANFDAAPTVARAEPRYHYAGATIARTDLDAAVTFTRLFLQAVPRARIASAFQFFNSLEAVSTTEYSHVLLVGSRSQNQLGNVLQRKSSHFRFDFSDGTGKGDGKWTITDLVAPGTKKYTLDSPVGKSAAELYGEEYALLEKIIDQETGTTIFIVAGFTDKATALAAAALSKFWPELQKAYGRKPFDRLLRINSRLGTLGTAVIDRERQDAAPKPGQGSS